MREIGLEVLDIFEKELETQAKYDSPIFNNNMKYIYLPDDSEIIQTSPFYGFTLIPEITNKGVDSTSSIIYLLQFINWSIYFYNKLKDSYDVIASNPSKKMLSPEIDTSNILADIIFQLFPNKRKVKATKELITTDAKNRLSKNHAILKPTKFLQLCRFFTRAWFSEFFYVEGSIKFAYYINCYIVNNPYQVTKSKCSYYKANSRSKEEVNALFKDKEQSLRLLILVIHLTKSTYSWSTIYPKIPLLQQKSLLRQYKQTIEKLQYDIDTNISFQLMDFTIHITKTYNTLSKRFQKLSWFINDVNLTIKDFQYHWKHFCHTVNIDKMAIYTISVEQRGSEYIFYKYARLHLDRYDRLKF